jgi:hypothetical protein
VWETSPARWSSGPQNDCAKPRSAHRRRPHTRRSLASQLARLSVCSRFRAALGYPNRRPRRTQLVVSPARANTRSCICLRRFEHVKGLSIPSALARPRRTRRGGSELEQRVAHSSRAVHRSRVPLPAIRCGSQNVRMGIAAAVILVLLVLVPTVAVLGLFVWAARRDGEEDRAVQARLGIRRRTRLGR